jgi:hypothetical protein
MKLSNNVRQVFKTLNILIVVVVAGYITWNILNSLTGNALERRYMDAVTDVNENKQQAGRGVSTEYELRTTGRDKIMMADLKIFLRYPILGVGPGNSITYRAQYINVYQPPHTEFTRLLCDHGLYGLIALLIILLTPRGYSSFLPTTDNKTFLICLLIFSFFTQFHAAMRLAIPGFTYGMAFLIFDIKSKSLRRRDHLNEIQYMESNILATAE